MTDDDLAWLAEQACLNAWPAPRQVLADRWIVRAAGGASRRLNSINPLRSHRYDPRAALAVAEPLYAALGQPVLFRVPAIASGLGAALDADGWDTFGDHRTLFASLEGEPPPSDTRVVLRREPGPAWLALRAKVTAADPEAGRMLPAVLSALMLPRAFAAVHATAAPGTAEAVTAAFAPERDATAIAFAAMDRGLLVLEAVVTDPAHRGRGHGRAVVAALMAWGRRQGAFGACLQVLGDNAPATALYRSLGFSRELYRYCYRARPAGR